MEWQLVFRVAVFRRLCVFPKGLESCTALKEERVTRNERRTSPAARPGPKPGEPRKEKFGPTSVVRLGGDARGRKAFQVRAWGGQKPVFADHGAKRSCMKSCPGVKTYLPEDLPEDLREDLREGLLEGLLEGLPEDPSEGPDASEDRREEASPAFFSMSSTRWAV